MKLQKMTAKLDRIGMTASTLCAIHCAAVPLLITLLPLVGLDFLAQPWVEWGMIVLALIIGVSSISISFFNSHHKLLPIILLITGFVIIITGHALLRGWIEGIIVPIGGLVIVAAHFINNKYAGSCQSAARIIHLNHVHDEKN